jgi:predicted protein tyrosine phosphatase
MMINLLFVCSGDGARSRTARRLFSQQRGVSVRSAQLGAAAETKVDRAALRWADVIVVMERRQRRILEQRFKWSLCAKRLFCLDIRDDFACMEPALQQLLRERAVAMMPWISPQNEPCSGHPDDSPGTEARTPPRDSRAPSDAWPASFQTLGFSAD